MNGRWSPRENVRRAHRRAEVRVSAIETGTAERLLDGRLPADDTPDDLKAVARALEAVSAAPSEAELAGASSEIAVLAAALRDGCSEEPSGRARARGRKRKTALLAAATTAVAFGLFGGLAAANVLPRAAQRFVADVFGSVGVSIPTADDGGSNQPERGPNGATHHPAASGESSDGDTGSAADHPRGATATVPITGATGGAAPADPGAGASTGTNGDSSSGSTSGVAPPADPPATPPDTGTSSTSPPAGGGNGNNAGGNGNGKAIGVGGGNAGGNGNGNAGGNGNGNGNAGGNGNGNGNAGGNGNGNGNAGGNGNGNGNAGGNGNGSAGGNGNGKAVGKP